MQTESVVVLLFLSVAIVGVVYFVSTRKRRERESQLALADSINAKIEAGRQNTVELQRHIDEAMTQLDTALEENSRQIGRMLIEDRRKQVFTKREELLARGNLVLVTNFVQRYGSGVTVAFRMGLSDWKNSQQGEQVMPQELLVFKRLMASKGVELENEIFRDIVWDEVLRQDFDNFRQSVSKDPGVNLDALIVEFLNYPFRNERSEYSYLLLELLSSLGVDGTENSSEWYIDEWLAGVRRDQEIARMEVRLSAGQSDNKSIVDLDLMDGAEFESFLSLLFGRMGFAVRLTQLSCDQGADLVVEKNGIVTVVQAKRYVTPVGNKAVQEVVASLRHYSADRAMVVTTSEFTSSAKVLAHSNGVQLVDREQMSDWLREWL
jgi:hypothetical protein